MKGQWQDMTEIDVVEREQENKNQAEKHSIHVLREWSSFVEASPSQTLEDNDKKNAGDLFPWISAEQTVTQASQTR
jgi:hypothetical protein